MRACGRGMAGKVRPCRGRSASPCCAPHLYREVRHLHLGQHKAVRPGAVHGRGLLPVVHLQYVVRACVRGSESPSETPTPAYMLYTYLYIYTYIPTSTNLPIHCLIYTAAFVRQQVCVRGSSNRCLALVRWQAAAGVHSYVPVGGTHAQPPNSGAAVLRRCRAGTHHALKAQDGHDVVHAQHAQEGARRVQDAHDVLRLRTAAVQAVHM